MPDMDSVQPNYALRPRLGVVITSWQHEDGADYARQLVDTFPGTVPVNQVDIVMCPRLLEQEDDIPDIMQHLAADDIDALCLVPGNFTLDHVMPILAQQMRLPTILWAIPTQEAWGALVGMQQTLFPFKELGLDYRFVIGELGDARTWDKVLPYARAAALKKRIAGMRIGLMGWRAQGMSDVTFDELALREVFGVYVINVGLTRYARAVEGVDEGVIRQCWEQMAPGLDISETTQDVADYGIRSYLALERLVEEERLNAFTVECFHDHLGGPCLGKSIFNDRGIAASCESDVPSTIVMAAGQILSGEPAFHADFINVNPATNSAILHHCGNMPRRLAATPERLRLRSIPEHIGPGAYGPVINATMKAGPVTLANLVGRRGNLRLSALEGEVVPYTPDFPGSGAKVVFPYNLSAALEVLGNAGSGHHFSLFPGHWGREMAEWARLLKLDYLQPTMDNLN
jgi:L-fucose isomerase-like protein